MKAKFLLAALAGLGLGTALVAYYGLDAVGSDFLAAGWCGLAAITAFQLLPVAACGFAWRIIAENGRRGSSLVFLWARYIRDGIGNLFALIPGAGEIAGTRALALHGIDARLAAATTIVDMTAELLAQAAFTAIGLLLLFLDRPGEPILYWGAWGLAFAIPAALGFFIAQRAGLFKLVDPIVERFAQSFHYASGGPNLHEAIVALYRRPSRISASFLIHLTAWILAGAGTWVALQFIGHPLPLSQAIVIESLVFALRSAAFIVPWGAGIQEGGYVVVGAVFGLPPEAALAISLLKRARDLVLGVPAAAAWQLLEGQRIWRRTKARPHR
ncbi:MAG: lysylphosphatidylglycerol synthase domain-containing protein [Alphaproteobacteria bacterium]